MTQDSLSKSPEEVEFDYLPNEQTKLGKEGENMEQVAQDKLMNENLSQIGFYLVEKKWGGQTKHCHGCQQIK